MGRISLSASRGTGCPIISCSRKSQKDQVKEWAVYASVAATFLIGCLITAGLYRAYPNKVTTQQQERVTFYLPDSTKVILNSESNFEAASNGLRTSVTKISELESKRGLLMADIDRAKANLELAEINLSYTTITSPFTGYTALPYYLSIQLLKGMFF